MNGRVHNSSLAVVLNYKEKQFQELSYRLEIADHNTRVQENTLAKLRAIPQKAFQQFFQNWRKHSERCIRSGGNYSEMDKAE